MPTPRSDLSKPPEPSPKGRPNAERANKIRQLIIEVAAEVMLEQGFVRTTLDSIASGAGVTKRTIYDRFGSKEALLRQVLLSSARPVRGSFAVPTSITCRRQRLIAITTGLHERWMDPWMQRWLRLAASECTQEVNMVPVLQGALDNFHDFVEEMLRAELGELGPSIDSTTVRVFTSMIAAPPQAHALLGLDAGSPEEQKIYIERAVDMLLAGVSRLRPTAADCVL